MNRRQEAAIAVAFEAMNQRQEAAIAAAFTTMNQRREAGFAAQKQRHEFDKELIRHEQRYLRKDVERISRELSRLKNRRRDDTKLAQSM